MPSYPWRFPEVVHEHLNDPDDWWAALQPGLATAEVAAGLDPLEADAVAAEVRSCCAVPEAFLALRRHHRGAAHVPRCRLETGDRVQPLSRTRVARGRPRHRSVLRQGVLVRVHRIRKPPPSPIELALEYFGGDVAWMIGNSAKSDIGAAHAAGIPSVLVVRDRQAPLVETGRSCSVRAKPVDIESSDPRISEVAPDTRAVGPPASGCQTCSAPAQPMALAIPMRRPLGSPDVAEPIHVFALDPLAARQAPPRICRPTEPDEFL